MKYIIIIFAFLFIPGHVLATNFSFSQSPKVVDIIARPGSEVTLPFILTNAGDPTVMNIRAYRVTYTDSSGYPTLTAHNSSDEGDIDLSLNGTPLLQSEPFFVQTSEAIEYEVVAQVSESARTGDFIFAFVGESVPTQGFENASSVQFQPGVGSLVVISVTPDGALDTDARISQFAVQSPYSITLWGKRYAVFDSFQDIPILLNISNSGVHKTRVAGSISVTSRLFGNHTQLRIVKPHYVWGESSRLVKTSDVENDESSVSLQAPFMGVFQVRPVLQNGVISEPGESDQWYIVFPFTALVGVSFTSLLLLTLYVFVRRMREEV